MFQIRTYGKGELAQLYCPNITTAAARKKLMSWIHYYPNLMELSTGSFEGLRARGNFTVAASWKDAKITSFKVDGECEFADVELPEAQADATFVSCDGTEYKADGRMIRVSCGKCCSIK